MDMRNAYKILAGKPEEMRKFGRGTNERVILKLTLK
jgi:hypothetical protein